MAILEGWRFLSSSRFKMIIQTLSGKLDLTHPLIFLKRTPVVQAFDDEIVGRFTGRVFAADIIADDQEAPVYESGKLELVTNIIPNLKIGQRLSQTILNRMAKMKMGALLPGDNDAMELFMQRMAENLLYGVRIRMNALICAMQLDALNYNRLGIQVQGTWQMPAALKVTAAVPWSLDGVNANPSATPISDILTIANEVAPDNYGIRFDRATMSSRAFRFAVSTTEFANKAKAILGFEAGQGTLSTHDTPVMLAMMGRLLNMEVELYDAAFWERNPDGGKSRYKVLPVNKVLLSMKQNDGDGNVMDFANGVVTESMVASLTGNAPAGLGGEQYGPVGYYTGREDLNPPDVTAWAVARGFPRKHVPESTGALTVGSYA